MVKPSSTVLQKDHFRWAGCRNWEFRSPTRLMQRTQKESSIATSNLPTFSSPRAVMQKYSISACDPPVAQINVTDDRLSRIVTHVRERD